LGWLFRYVVFFTLVLALGGAVAGRWLYRAYATDLPDIADIERFRSEAPGVTRVHAADGTLLAELAREHRAYVAIEDVPRTLVAAFLAAEDRRFYEHDGVDFRGIARAASANLASGSVVQGGSTITQQVAKSFLGDEQTIDRKIREAILAVRMESTLGKDGILEIYLNKIFLGHGAYGVAAAARRYFGKDLDELTTGECALIAGLARAPSRYSPVLSLERAQDRRDVVLQDMVEAGVLAAQARDAAMAEPIVLAESARDPFRWRSPWYAEHVRRVVGEALGEATVLEGGLVIETPDRLDAEHYGRRAVDVALRRIDRRQGWRGPIAHLRTAEQRAALDARLTALHGTEALAIPGQWHLALVTGVERAHADVKIGGVVARLPLATMRWAAPYDANTGLNDQSIQDVRHALVEGDVVWVRRPPIRDAGAAAGSAETESSEASDEAPAPAGADDGLEGAVIPPPLPPIAPPVAVALDGGVAGDAGDASPPASLAVPIEVELGQTPRVEAALLLMDHRNGYVEAMIGGHDYDRSQFNRPLQACRQPGSVFKAIYYALALDGDEYAADSILEGKAYVPEPGETWSPSNIDKTVDGKVLLRTSLIRSLNTSSLRLFLRLGAKDVVAWARRLGFEGELIADKALALGASCVHTDELARAFAIYAQGGAWVEPVYVTRVTDERGRVLMDARDPLDGGMDVAGRLDRMAARVTAGPTQVIDERTAFLISRLLREVVTAGIAARAGRVKVPVAGKTGTASKGPYTTDTWFVGFTSRHVATAWMGDDKYERSLGDEDASFTTAIPMWVDFMKPIVAGVPHYAVPGEKPAGISSRIVDATYGGPPVGGFPSALIYFKVDSRAGLDEGDRPRPAHIETPPALPPTP
jgi:penicillin-binding protein 1A